MTKALRPSTTTQPATDRPEAQGEMGNGLNGMSPAETARYVAEFSAELSYLARQAKLDLLAYLLDMARLEAIRSVETDEKDH